MEMLDDKGNGNYAYVDTIAEATRSFTTWLGLPIADTPAYIAMKASHHRMTKPTRPARRGRTGSFPRF